MTLFTLSASLILGAVFLMSAVPKLAAPRRFANDVQQYRLLPRPLASAFGYAIPYAELAAAALLMTGVYTAWAALGVAVMLGVFMVAVGVAMVRKLNLTCSCFGLLYRERVGWSTQIRDGVLLALALFIFVADTGGPTMADMLADPERLDHAIGLVLTLTTASAAVAIAVLSAHLARRQHGHP
ncbi:MAG: DoxX family membrane protein [Chloroflexota bacterium]|nr:DoxX family membrane protein [Chloroflexota bacterium]